jgi:hypothetical protein
VTLPYYVVFILFAVLITWFSSRRRSVEREFLRSRDELQNEAAARAQQARLLNLTYETIFVRDMNDVIYVLEQRCSRVVRVDRGAGDR